MYEIHYDNIPRDDDECKIGWNLFTWEEERLYTWEVEKYEDKDEYNYIDDSGVGDITYWAPPLHKLY